MATVNFKSEEAFVLIEFLLRFRDDETLTIAHPAEKQMLWDLCAMLESQVPELLDPKYGEKLNEARLAVTSDEWE